MEEFMGNPKNLEEYTCISNSYPSKEAVKNGMRKFIENYERENIPYKILQSGTYWYLYVKSDSKSNR